MSRTRKPDNSGREANATRPEVACTLSPRHLKACREELLPGLIGKALDVTPLSDGYRWTFRAEELRFLGRVLENERRCCRFLRFVLTLEPETGSHDTRRHRPGRHRGVSTAADRIISRLRTVVTT